MIQTLGYALTDSPVALITWIYERLHDWPHQYPWTKDEVHTWILIYWFGTAANVLLYYDSVHLWHSMKLSKVVRNRVNEHVPRVKIKFVNKSEKHHRISNQ